MTEAQTPETAPAPPRELYLGTAGWSYPDWRGPVYPVQVPRDFDALAYIASYVDTLEINTSFYHIPATRTVESWVKRVERWPRFRFTMKAWQGFTHGAGDDHAPAPAEAAQAVPQRAQADAAGILHQAGRLGALLFQYPYIFRHTQDHQDEVLHTLDSFSRFPRVVEFRHRSWLAEEFLSALAQRGVAFCNIDQPMMMDNLPPTDLVTAPLRYIRMHGRNREQWFSRTATVEQRYSYFYSEAELQPWVERAHRLAAGGATYFIFNNHGQGQALANSVMAQAMLRGYPSEEADRPMAPPSLAARYPILQSVARIEEAPGLRTDDGQLNLF